MSRDPTAADLHPARQRLLALMRTLGYGRIEGLRVSAGQPVLDPLPRMVREVKFPQEGEPTRILPADPERTVLKKQHRQFLALLDQVGDGVIESVVVCNGLPFRADVPVRGP